MFKHFKFRYFTVFISALFILSGAVNNGSTGQFFAIPFWLIFFASLFRFPNKQRVNILIIVALLYIPLVSNHEENILLYPKLGSSITLSGNWGYNIHYDSNYKYLSPPHEQPRETDKYTIETGEIDSSYPLIMARISTNHADFGTTLVPVFQTQDGKEYRIHASSLITELSRGTVHSSELEGLSEHEFQSNWSRRFSLLLMWPVLILIALKN